MSPIYREAEKTENVSGEFHYSLISKNYLWPPSLHTQELLPYMYRLWYTLPVGKRPKSPTGIGAQPEASKDKGNAFRQFSSGQRRAENPCGTG
jgi:hypothetical protein